MASSPRSRTSRPMGSDENLDEGGLVSEMEAQIDALKAEIASLTRQISASGGRSIDALRKAAAGSTDDLMAQGEAALEGLRTGARDMEEQVAEAVREKPMTALALAAGVGFLVARKARR